jgi:hypothetical protein
MSGSGGGGGGGGGVSDYDDCAKIHRTTNVVSPSPSVLEDINEGDMGKLRLGSGAKHPIEVVMTGNKVLGTIVGEGVTHIKKCLEEGSKFSVKVTRIKGGAVTVEIRAA